jgi:hypothetical protein
VSPRRRSRRRARRSRRVFTIQYDGAPTFTPPEGFIFAPDGWEPEADNKYAIITVRSGDAPYERWYRWMPDPVEVTL